jgi:hypothetical protein
MKWSCGLFLIWSHAAAQFAEPILTRSAIPIPAGTVSLKLDFVSPVDAKAKINSQTVPESFLEIGLGRGFETVLQWPLLRVSEPGGSSVLAAGQLSIALRYLLAGSPASSYAIAIAGRVEVPSGDSHIVGNETQLMPTILAEWHAAPDLLLRSNLSWNTTIAGTTGRFAFLEYSNAAVWLASRHWMPVIELVGSTNTVRGGTQMIVQPEIIVAPSRHLELKTGLSFGLVSTSQYAIRSQFAWVWGKRAGAP